MKEERKKDVERAHAVVQNKDQCFQVWMCNSFYVELCGIKMWRHWILILCNWCCCVEFPSYSDDVWYLLYVVFNGIGKRMRNLFKVLVLTLFSANSPNLLCFCHTLKCECDCWYHIFWPLFTLFIKHGSCIWMLIKYDYQDLVVYSHIQLSGLPLCLKVT